LEAFHICSDADDVGEIDATLPYLTFIHDDEDVHDNFIMTFMFLIIYPHMVHGGC